MHVLLAHIMVCHWPMVVCLASANFVACFTVAGCEVPLRVKKGTTVLAFKFPGGIIVGVDSRIVDMLGQPGQYLISKYNFVVVSVR